MKLIAVFVLILFILLISTVIIGIYSLDTKESSGFLSHLVTSLEISTYIVIFLTIILFIITLAIIVLHNK